ncbi:uncharacterized protein DNG_05765 [Cephalotrichum gorgonifer]|uniref:DUF7719 domain-containing protein n=1 Tax=Cephalotrichum gorgonifer TaxID=2041049 RepID=A0AAE8N0G0_9PEZI|nr:uncharacterized protein DNG_05765 [Cephalotrichum gorgonifer]
MARKRKDPTEIKLAHPDRSGPTEATLLDWAQERDLFAEAKRRERALRREKKKKEEEKAGGAARRRKPGEESSSDEDEEEDEATFTPGQERVLDALLWTGTLASVHFTLDVLVQHQYASDIEWNRVVLRSGQAFLVFLLLIYALHPHRSSPNPIPLLPRRYQHLVSQAGFLATSVAAGSYLFHLTNTSGYMAVMKRAPTVGCLWLWGVVELDLGLSLLSVLLTGAFVFSRGYKIM